MKLFKKISRYYPERHLTEQVQSKLDDFAKLRRESCTGSDLIQVDINIDGLEAYATDGIKTFYFRSSSMIDHNDVAGEFALWAFLPIAMAQGKNLVINSSCSEQALANAGKLVEAWSCWLPSLFSLIKIYSTSKRKLRSNDLPRRDLLCFSGGVDSTYTLLTRKFSTFGFDLLTVQGMDYHVSDDERFEKAKLKSNLLLKDFNCDRLYIKTNAYSLYKEYDIQPRYIYVFVLMGCASLFSERYASLVLAADRVRYQQLEDVPYGSSYATDQFFDNGDFKLLSHADDVTRAEKLPEITKNSSALASLSFCKNRKYRPENCGVCEKCMRTKYMFLATIGTVPEKCFINGSVDIAKKVFLSKVVNREEAFVKATYAAGFWSGNLSKVPMIVDAYQAIKNRKK